MNDKLVERLESLSEELAKSWDSYSYIKSTANYYWKNQKKFFKSSDVANNLMATNQELNWLRQYWIIKTYDDICYLKWWRDKSLNLLEESRILIPSSNPEIDNNIKTLIDNVCGFKQENIDYLHRAILYKYHNLNDFTTPCIVLYGKGGSGKGTLMSLFWTIFWEPNIMSNLWQRDLTWAFDTYKWQKLVVEFAEITTNNTNSDMKILNKLKNIIWAERITINEKWVQAYQIDNIAWFFISSNSNQPLQLDDKDKGNRRFTIFRSTSKLNNWELVNKVIRDKTKVQNYLAWLYKTFPEVLEYKKLDALDNQDKRDLEDRSQNSANDFWEWLEDTYPEYTWKKTIKEINTMINEFCLNNDLIEQDFIKYFWKNSRYLKKKIRIGDKTFYWVDIPIKEILTVKDVEEIFK